MVYRTDVSEWMEVAEREDGPSTVQPTLGATLQFLRLYAQMAQVHSRGAQVMQSLGHFWVASQWKIWDERTQADPHK